MYTAQPPPTTHSPTATHHTQPTTPTAQPTQSTHLPRDALGPWPGVPGDKCAQPNGTPPHTAQPPRWAVCGGGRLGCVWWGAVGLCVVGRLGCVYAAICGDCVHLLLSALGPGVFSGVVRTWYPGQTHLPPDAPRPPPRAPGGKCSTGSTFLVFCKLVNPHLPPIAQHL